MMSSLEPAAVLSTLPVDLRKAFEDSDEVMMKAALSNLSGELKKYHWSRIQASGLWSPGMQWKHPLPTSMVAQPLGKHISITFNGPMGLLLDPDRLDTAMVRQLDPDSEAKARGVTVGATIVSVNGKSAAGMRRDQVIALVQDAAFPKNIAFALPATTPPGAATAPATPKRTAENKVTFGPTAVVTPDRKELCVTFRVRPLGIHISDTIHDRAVIKALDASSPASTRGIPLGASITSLNGKSTAGMSRDAVVANIMRAPFPKTIAFTPPDTLIPATAHTPPEASPKSPEASPKPPEASPKPLEAAPNPPKAANNPLEASLNPLAVSTPNPLAAAPRPKLDPAPEQTAAALEIPVASKPALKPMPTAELAALPLSSPASVVQPSWPSNIEVDAAKESRPEAAAASLPHQSPAMESMAPSKTLPIETSSELAAVPPYSLASCKAQKQAPSPGHGRGGAWLIVILLAICIVAVFDGGLKIVRGVGIPSLLSPSPPPACHWQGMQGCMPSNRFTSSCRFLLSLNGKVCYGAN